MTNDLSALYKIGRFYDADPFLGQSKLNLLVELKRTVCRNNFKLELSTQRDGVILLYQIIFIKKLRTHFGHTQNRINGPYQETSKVYETKEHASTEDKMHGFVWMIQQVGAMYYETAILTVRSKIICKFHNHGFLELSKRKFNNARVFYPP